MSNEQFIKPYGQKIVSGEHYFPDDDTTDQRSPVNNIEDLYNQFVVPEDVMDELDSENVEDFDNDIYDYDDRSEFGEDIAAAGQIDMEEYIASKQKQKKPAKADIDTDGEPAE